MKNPSTITEAVEFAAGLMKGDPETFKQGYTLENAAIAVAEVFGFDRQEIERELHNQMVASPSQGLTN